MKRVATALAFVWALSAFALAAPGDPVDSAATCAVVVRSSAESSGLTIRLGDVATITGGPEERRRRLEVLDVAATPGPSTTQALSCESLRATLRASGFDAEATKLAGPLETRVQTRGRTYLPANLSEAARSYVSGSIEPETGVEVTIEPPDIAAPVVVPLGRESNDVVFDWAGPHRDRGPLSVSAEFRVDGKRYLRLPLRITARAFANALMPKTRLRRGDAASAAALERRRVEVTDLREALVHDGNELAPLRVARDLEPGRPLVRSDFYLPPAVRKGDTLRLVAKRGSLTVSTLVLAQKDGVVGDVIPVKNVDSQRIVMARVRGPGLLEADASSTPAPAAVANDTEEVNDHEPQR